MSGFSATDSGGGKHSAEAREPLLHGGSSRGATAAETRSRRVLRRFSALRAGFRRLCVCAAALLPLALTGCVFLGTQAFKSDEAATLGVIGGADGSTQVVVTTLISDQNTLTPLAVGLLVVLGIAVAVSVVILIRRGRKNKK